MKKLFAIVLIVLFLTGCAAQAVIPTETTDPNKAQVIIDRFPAAIDFETYQQITSANYHSAVTYPWNYVSYNRIRSLGDYVYYIADSLLEGNRSYFYKLQDSNNISFFLSITHKDFVLKERKNATLVPGAESMAQIAEVDSKEYLQIVSNGFVYHYSSGRLCSITGMINDICFEISSVSSGFGEYPADGERTLLSLLLSTDSKDQQAGKRMLQRCFPKTWVHYAAYCGIALVAVTALVVFFVIRARRAKKKTALVACDVDANTP